MARYKRYNNNEGEFFAGVVVIIGFILFNFIVEYWEYILGILLILVFYYLVRKIIDLDLKSDFKRPHVYYKGMHSEAWLDNLIKENDQIKIATLKRGMYGENSILYELENSRIPMYIMHDLKLNYDGYKSQIDIIAVTKKNVYVLESKNLKGNVDVQKDGTMIRKSKFGRRGFKNPVTQTSKHEELLKDILKNEKVKTKLTFWTILTNDSSFIKSDLSNKVMRNDKLILNMKKKESKKHIVRKEDGIKKLCDTILKYEVKEGDYNENI